MIDSRLEEMCLEEKRRRPMTPAEMVRFYGGVKGQPSHKKGYFLVNLGQTLMALGGWFKRGGAETTALGERSASRAKS